MQKFSNVESLLTPRFRRRGRVMSNAPSILERFGLSVLRVLKSKHQSDDNVPLGPFNVSDAELNIRITLTTIKCLILTGIASVVFVFPMVSVAIATMMDSVILRLCYVTLVTIGSLAVELVVLFVIALWGVHSVSQALRVPTTTNNDSHGVFEMQRILARTALEIDDPETQILGIDPFKCVNKHNLLVMGLIYKLKIVITNAVIKVILHLITGGSEFVGEIPIACAAFPVEIFWNCVVIWRVIKEARLRLCGLVLSSAIARNAAPIVAQLSPMAAQGCLRAIANSVIMTRNYHPNMMLLFLRFQDIVLGSGNATSDGNVDSSQEDDNYGDWQRFLFTLHQVSAEERNFILDVLTVAAAFDGKISDLESEHLSEAYEDDYNLYLGRLEDLTNHLRRGHVNAAYLLCGLDFVKG
jgi:hypothetical protein